jgi:hypothetical protein
VREKVADAGLVSFTAAVTFDAAEGWDLEKAEAWLAKHLARENICRFVSLSGDRTRRL